MIYESQQEVIPGRHVWDTPWDRLSEEERGMNIAVATRLIQKLTEENNAT